MKLGLARLMALRYLVLVPMAYCIYLLLSQNDLNTKLAAVIALIILEQIRDWSLLSGMERLAKGNKP